MKKIIQILIKILLLYSFIVGVLFYFEDDLIFYGAKFTEGENVRNNLIKKTEVNKYKLLRQHLVIDDMKIETLIKKFNDGIERKKIFYIGGNAEDSIWIFQSLTKIFDEYEVYTFNYPGYGTSEGKATEDRINSVIDKVVLFNELDKQKIILIGRSLGTGFAVQLASRLKNIEKLILVTPYDNMSNVANQHYFFVPKLIIDVLLKNKLASDKFIKNVECKVFVLYAENDIVIDNRLTENLILNIKDNEVKKNERVRT